MGVDEERLGEGFRQGQEVASRRTDLPQQRFTSKPDCTPLVKVGGLAELLTEKRVMEPLKDLIERAWENLTDGWRELLARGSGALTHFRADGAGKKESPAEFPSWSLLAAETWETAKSVVIRVEIPGMDERDLHVDVDGNVLRIRGEKRSGAAQQRRQYHLMERAYGHFERSIPLPHGVDAERAEVSYRNGVLTAILPKTDTLPPRRLTISN